MNVLVGNLGLKPLKPKSTKKAKIKLQFTEDNEKKIPETVYVN